MAQTLDLETEVRIGSNIMGGTMPQEDFIRFWPNISEALDKVPEIWSYHWTKESLYSGVMMGRFQVWGFGPPNSVNVIVFTEIAVFPANRIFRLFMAFGNSLEFAAPMMEAVMMRYAQEAGCGYCEVFGRPGWERKFPQLKRVGVILRCPVEKKRIH